MVQPPPLQRDLTWGQLFIPYTGDGRWLTPIGRDHDGRGAGARAALPASRGARWSTYAPGSRTSGEADLVGALLLATALGGIILAFATADPEVQVFSEQGPWFLLGSARRHGRLPGAPAPGRRHR